MGFGVVPGRFQEVNSSRRNCAGAEHRHGAESCQPINLVGSYPNRLPLPKNGSGGVPQTHLGLRKGAFTVQHRKSHRKYKKDTRVYRGTGASRTQDYLHLTHHSSHTLSDRLPHPRASTKGAELAVPVSPLFQEHTSEAHPLLQEPAPLFPHRTI